MKVFIIVTAVVVFLIIAALLPLVLLYIIAAITDEMNWRKAKDKKYKQFNPTENGHKQSRIKRSGFFGCKETKDKKR